MTTLFPYLMYLVGIASAELITALADPMGGMIVHLVLVVLLILSSAMVGRHPSHRLFLAMTLAPLIRIVGLSVSLPLFSEIYWYLLTSIPLLVGVLVIIRILDLQPREIGLTPGRLPVQGLIALTGVSFGGIAFLILRPEPLAPTLSWQYMVAPALILLIATGFVEELAFRGVMQHASIQALGPWGWVYTAGIYSVLQIGQLSVLHWLFVLCVALFFGWVAKRTGSILGVSLSHGLANIGLLLVFPLLT